MFSHLTRIDLNKEFAIKHTHIHLLLCLAPNLRSIGFADGFKLHEDALKYVNGRTSLSVKMISVTCYFPSDFNEVDFATFVGLFPNVMTVVVPNICLDKVSGLKEQCPGLVIEDDFKFCPDPTHYRWFYGCNDRISLSGIM